MSTFITVAQEGSQLLRRNQEQTQARRLARTEGDEQKQTEQQARKARQDALQQQNLDASGNVLSDGRRRRFRPDEPAASFVPTGGIGHLWTLTADNDDGAKLGLTLACAGGTEAVTLAPLDFTVRELKPYAPAVNITSNVYEGGNYVITAYTRSLQTIYYDGFITSTGFALPVGRDTFIYVSLRSFWYYSVEADVRSQVATVIQASQTLDEQWFTFNYPANRVYGGVQHFTDAGASSRAFICSRNKIREITIPAVLQGALNAYHNPQPVTKTEARTLNYYNSSGTGLYVLNAIYQYADSIEPQGSTGLDVASASSAAVRDYTPAVFAAMQAAATENNYSLFSDPSVIKTFPTSKRWVAADINRGTYQSLHTATQDWEPLLKAGISLNYGDWPAPGEQPDYDAAAPVRPRSPLTLTMQAAPGTPLATALDPGGSTETNVTELLTTIWDWDDPAYCRSMCLALGFTSADLTP